VRSSKFLSSRDKGTARRSVGVAGAGKTTFSSRDPLAAERDGYKVEGFAQRHARQQKLGEAGRRKSKSSTLGSGIWRGAKSRTTDRRRKTGGSLLTFLTIESLAEPRKHNDTTSESAKGKRPRIACRRNTANMKPSKRRRPYHQLQECGIETARLDDDRAGRKETGRSKSCLATLTGNVREGKQIERLSIRTGRVHEIPDRTERPKGIAQEYDDEPKGTLVCRPPTNHRRDDQSVFHREMQSG